VVKVDTTDVRKSEVKGPKPWRIKKGRRLRRVEKHEYTWYKDIGSTNPCAICASDHPALEMKLAEDGERTYSYCCPIAKGDIWPPNNAYFNLWDSLEPSPEKFAEFYHFNTEDINRMLEVWETSIFSLVIPMVECEEFKKSVRMITDEERQSWTFKRSPIYLPTDMEYEDTDNECVYTLTKTS